MSNSVSAKVWLSPPTLAPNSQEYVADALASGWIAPTGPYCDRFQKALEAYSGKFCLAVNSGTAALQLALRLAGVAHGDEVFCSDFTFIATASPIKLMGAKPVLVDCEEQSWNMDPLALESAIADRLHFWAQQNRPAPLKAIILCHSYGLPGQLDAILAIARKHNLILIEDAAEAMGSTLAGKPLGTLAHMGVWSFNGNKIITCSAGGCLVVPDMERWQKAQWYATQCKDPEPHFEHRDIGYNFAMSNVLAALGLSQLEDLEPRVKQRRRTFADYCAMLESHLGTPGPDSWSFPREVPGARANRWLSTFWFSTQRWPGLASRLRQGLQQLQIESRPLWKPMHLQKAFQQDPIYSVAKQVPVGARLFANGICLPSGATESRVESVLRNVI